MSKLTDEVYDRELRRMQTELVDLQAAVREQGLRVAILMEGRDTAGKGGTISRITKDLNPRAYRVVALGVPTEREKGQWYFQRYVSQLPATGEIVPPLPAVSRPSMRIATRSPCSRTAAWRSTSSVCIRRSSRS